MEAEMFRILKSALVISVPLSILISISVFAESGTFVNVLFPPQSAATLNGSITTSISGQPAGALDEATISLYSKDRILLTTSDRSGHFKLANIPAGTYQLEATHPGFQPKKIANFVIPNQNAEPLSIALQIASSDCSSPDSISYDHGLSGRAVTGVVLDGQEPLSSAKVAIMTPGASQVSVTQTANTKGEFEFKDLEPGQYVLRVSHPEYHDEVTESFWVARESGTRGVVRMLKQGMLRVCQ
jgi:hypothetical protein